MDHLPSAAEEERTDGKNDVLIAAVNIARPDAQPGDLPQTTQTASATLVAPNADTITSSQILGSAHTVACEADMVPLPEDHPDDFPIGPPTTEPVANVTGRDAATVPLPDDADDDFPPVAELQATQAPGESAVIKDDLAAVPPNDSPNPPKTETPPAPPADTSPEENKAAASVNAADPSIEAPSPPESKNPEPGPVSELDRAIATPLPDDTLAFTFVRGTSLKSIDELRTVFTDIYTHHYLAYKHDGTVYGSFIPNQIMAMRNKKTGEVSGVFLDCDPLPTDPILQEIRSVEDIPPYDNIMAVDYKLPWKLSSYSLRESKKYYRHDAEALFYFWCTYARRMNSKGYCYTRVPPTAPSDKRSWFWDHAGALSTFRTYSEECKAAEEVWMALWKLIGDAYFFSRGDPKHETLSGYLTPEKVLEAIGVDVESLTSTAADEDSVKEYVSDSD